LLASTGELGAIDKVGLVVGLQCQLVACNCHFKSHHTRSALTSNQININRAMLEEGVYLAPSQFEAGFTGLQHTDADIEFTIEAARRALKRI